MTRYSRFCTHACDRLHIMFAAECKWSELMDNYACEKTSAIRCQENKKTRWKQSPLRYFQVGYIHNPVKLILGVEVNKVF